MKPSDLPRKPLTPQTIVARLVAIIFGIATFLAVFVFPWLFSAVRLNGRGSSLRVRVIKVGFPTFWYADRVGEVFTVIEYPRDPRCYRLIDGLGAKERRLLEKADVEIVTE